MSVITSIRDSLAPKKDKIPTTPSITTSPRPVSPCGILHRSLTISPINLLDEKEEEKEGKEKERDGKEKEREGKEKEREGGKERDQKEERGEGEEGERDGKNGLFGERETNKTQSKRIPRMLRKRERRESIQDFYGQFGTVGKENFEQVDLELARTLKETKNGSSDSFPSPLAGEGKRLRRESVITLPEIQHSLPPSVPIPTQDNPFWYRKTGLEAYRSRSYPRLNVLILIIGSRGDIQPFMVLAEGLIRAGHSVRIGTHGTFKDFVEKNRRIEFVDIGGNPQKMMEFIVKNPSMLTVDYGQIRDQQNNMAEVFDGCWEATQKPKKDGMPYHPNVLICNPPTIVHVHLAEKLGIPLQIWFTMPWTPTDVYKHPFAWTGAGLYSNRNSYHLVDLISCSGNTLALNNWREKKLSLPPIWNAAGLQHSLSVPHVYCFSEILVPRPPDWGPHVDICGFLFPSSSSSKYSPPQDLLAFLDAGPPPVYIGFGSIVVPNPAKGWMGLGGDKLPDNIYPIGTCPHDWLFPRCSVVVHHGGAGTTSTGLLHGCPTVIIPFFGDQPFWGEVVFSMGVGPPPILNTRMTAELLATAIKECFAPNIVENARAMGEKLSGEKAQKKAVDIFHKYLPIDKEGRMVWRFYELQKYQDKKWKTRSSHHGFGDSLGLISRDRDSVKLGLGWEFSDPNWTMVTKKGETDIHGWQYSEGIVEGAKWHSSCCSSKMIFRRRAWERRAAKLVCEKKMSCRPRMAHGNSVLLNFD